MIKKINITVFLLLMVTQMFGQNIGISGTVLDRDSNEPIIGVQVVVEGTSRGAITDVNGKYNIRIQNVNQSLTFKFIGYKSQTIKVGNKKVIDVKLVEDAVNLDEVVAIGYMPSTKRELTTAVSSLNAEDLTQFNTANIAQAIQGLVPGVEINTTNGTPGAEMRFNIRGIGSVSNDANPLCVIDGVITSGGLNSLDVNDVASIQILKDAASAAIYGASGANGVILITTKQAENKKPTITYQAKLGMAEVEHYYEMMNARECMELMDEAGTQYWALPGFDPNLDTDWQKVITHKPFVQNHSISIKGATDKTDYAISASYFDQPGVVKNTGYKRYTGRAKFGVKMNNWLKMDFNLITSYQDKHSVRDRGQQGVEPVMTRTLQMPPMYPVFYEGAYWSQNNYTKDDLIPDPRDPSRLPGNKLPLSNVTNPLQLLYEQSIRDINRKLLMTIAFDVKLTNHLKFRPQFSYDISDKQGRNWRSSAIGKRDGRTTDGNASTNLGNTTIWTSENVLTYTNKFAKIHSVSAVAGFTASGSMYSNVNASASGFGSDALGTLNGGTVFTANETPYLQDRKASFFGRANYTLLDRYMLGVIVRVDGSSLFGPKHRFGTFPSISAGWVVSDEKFMDWAKSVVSILKLRGSYGITGNDNIGKFKYLGLFANRNYILNGDIVNGISLNNIANPELGWEQKNSTNIGMDLGLFNNRLFFTLDLYRDKTSNMLLNTNIPSTLGFPTMTMNIGSVENKGVEFSVNAYPVSTRNFKWNVGFNISANRNKVLHLSTSGDAIYDGYDSQSNITIENKPIGLFYGRVYKGVYMSWDEIRQLAADPNSGLAFDPNTIPGDAKFVDLNGDGVCDDDDRTIIGSPHPKFIAGLTNTFSYKNFTFSFLLNGQYGNQIYNYTLHDMARSANNNQIKAFTHRYKNDEDRGDGWFAILDQKKGSKTDRNKFSSYQLEDGSYLKIRNVSLSYSFPKKWVNSFKAKDITCSINVDNLYTFTHYTGMNVEAQHGTSPTALGLDYTSYPTPRTYTMTLNVTF